MSTLFSTAQQLKMSTFSRGIAVDSTAAERLSDGGTVPLSLHEYATTGGVTFVADGDVFVNAPFDEWYCTKPEAVLTVDPRGDDFVVLFRGDVVPVRTILLPGYLGIRDASGRAVTDVAMSHGDRLRLSPVLGCSLDCAFCDMAAMPYVKRPSEQLISAIEVAHSDVRLPVHHVLISGGTPNRRDFGYYDEVCGAVVASAGMPVDVMMVPRSETGWIDRLVDLGAHGFTINLEIYGDAAASSITRLKHRIGLGPLARNIERAVELTGGQGRVRSLIVAGLEPLESTLAGVKFVAELGCDPVLSPFRPADGTRLAGIRPPSTDYQERLYLESLEIANRNGVKLGPRCIPCQHNTLTFPDGSSDYYYSTAAAPTKLT
jgi:hypothetical protein